VNFVATILPLPSLESMKTDAKPQSVLKNGSRGADGGSISDVQVGDTKCDRASRGGIARRHLPELAGGFPALRALCWPRAQHLLLVSSKDLTPGEYHQLRSWSVISRDGSSCRTGKFLNTVETADDLFGHRRFQNSRVGGVSRNPPSSPRTFPLLKKRSRSPVVHPRRRAARKSATAT